MMDERWFGSLQGFLEPTFVIPAAADLVCKSIIILMISWGLTVLLRRRSAALRHLVWASGMVCLLMLPVLLVSVPKMQWQVIPQAFSAIGFSVDRGDELVVSDGPVVTVEAGDGGSPVSGSNRDDQRFLLWVILIAGVWGIGCAGYLGYSVLGMMRLRVACRESHPMKEGAWLGLIEEQSKRLGIRRRIRVMWCESMSMPMIFGIFRPTVLLPRTAVDWPADRRYSVLIHELAHIQRFDCVTQFLANLAVALYWFNPLVHLAIRKFRTEREYACDDFVLRAGAPASGYANHLLEIAKSLSASAMTSTTAVAMARRSTLEGRMLAILDEKGARQPAGWSMAGWVFLLAIAVTIGVAAMQLTVDGPMMNGSVDGLAGGEASSGDEVEQDVEEEKQLADRAHGRLTIEILSAESGEAVGGARLEIEVDDHSVNWRSDGEGRYRLPWPVDGQVEHLVITAWADGYVPRRMTFEPVDGQVFLQSPLRVEMQAGQPIGGLVQNQLGKALRGTKVHLRFDWQEVSQAGYVVTIPDQQVQTDKWGWWRCDTVPESLDHLQIKFTDPHYESDTEYDPTTKEVNKKLKDKIHTRIMHQIEFRGDGVV